MLRSCFALILLASLISLSACGTKGPLYTPTAIIEVPSSSFGLDADRSSRAPTRAA